ncbi:hypothetical protein [Specibacter sp. RAF43]|uniref:hypothetical protein n=1 Tax=Specibacter sp. RAF43 TaxID=3233057 RepID=UPI003F9900A1
MAILEYLFSYWWLAFPLAGLIAAGSRGLAKSREREHQRQVELYKLQHPGAPEDGTAPPLAPAGSHREITADDVAKVMDAHDGVNRRWLDYELDVGKLIDFPMMTDVRESLTVAFLRAKRDADALRPVAAEDMTSKSRWDDYRNAVNAFAVAFDVAEKEARRIKDTGFSEPERQRLNTARKLVNLAENEAASPAERQTAYRRARVELEGLIVLPDVTLASLEQKMAKMIERSQQPRP